MCWLNAKSCAKFTSVNYPLNLKANEKWFPLAKIYKNQ